MTPIFTCGGECGCVLGSGASGHTLSGAAATISTSVKRTGDRSVRLNPTATTAAWLSPANPSPATRHMVWRLYRRFDAHPAANLMVSTAANGSAARNLGLAYQSSDGKYYAGAATSAGASFVVGSSGITIPANDGVWHQIDVYVNASANPNTVDVKIDGQALGQLSLAVVAGDLTDQRNGNTVSASYDYYDDDWILSGTAADYPIGAGYVNHFVPTADGTHNVASSADFQRGNTAVDITNATTTAWQLVDDVPLPSGAVDEADNQRAVAPVNPTTDYVEGLFGPASGISTPTTAPRSVECLLAYHQIATQTGSMRVALNDNGTLGDVLNISAQAGVVTYRYARAHFATGPAGAWVIGGGGNGDFTDLRVRFFSADAAPDQCLDAIMLEAEFAEVAAGPRRVKPLFGNQAVNRAATF